MRELIVSTFLTLDGVMQGPGGPDEDRDGGFASGGWSVSYWDDQIDAFMNETMGKPFSFVIGRRTYDIFASHWPTSEEPGATEMNEATKYVASRGRPRLEWQNSVLLEGDAAQAVAALKQEDGPELQVHGSANLLQTLLRANLVDRFRLIVFPVVVGSGKRLFGEGTVPAGLRLVDSRTSGTGVVMATYEPAGPLEVGTFGSE